MRGKGLTGVFIAMLLSLLCLQVFVHFQIFADKPVPGVAAKFYVPERRHQNIDVPVWVMTGFMLPWNAPQVRSMRPLYPAAITLARTVGFVDVYPSIYKTPIGSGALGPYTPHFDRALNILLFANCFMAVSSLWVFFALCRRFGMEPISATMATLAAGSGFGFSFWVTQAIPEVFGYWAIACSLAAIVIGFESDRSASDSLPRKKRLWREVWIWAVIGLFIGILLLGKEIFCLPMFGGLLLLFGRRWAGLIPFCVMVLLPSMSWNYYMSKIVGAFDPVAYLNNYRFIIWLFQDLPPLPWSGRLEVLWGNLWKQMVSLVQAYAYVPVALAVVGMFCCRRLPRQSIVLAMFFLSFYALFLLSNFIMPRLMFMTWPVIFFFAWLGAEWLLERLSRLAPAAEREKYLFLLKGAALFGLMFLGTRQQFAWYMYG